MFEKSFLDSIHVVDWGYSEEDKAESFSYYQNWVSSGHANPLKYLQDERMLKREKLSYFFNDFQSAFVFLFSYAPEKKLLKTEKNELNIASYVTGFEGVDYHYWIKDKLGKIVEKLEVGFDDFSCAFTIDAQPVLERDLAYRAGLGWIGKNSMLINQEHGSYFIIASVLTNKKFDVVVKEKDNDHCGNCRACIDACPTQAIIPDLRMLNTSKCISTFTIELFKEETPPEGYSNSSEVYGCDICQDVCPWNNKMLKKVPLIDSTNTVKSFFKRPITKIVDDLNSMSNREFRRKFKHTPLERTGRIGVLKNLKPFIDKG